MRKKTIICNKLNYTRGSALVTAKKYTQCNGNKPDYSYDGMKLKKIFFAKVKKGKWQNYYTIYYYKIMKNEKTFHAVDVKSRIYSLCMCTRNLMNFNTFKHTKMFTLRSISYKNYTDQMLAPKRQWFEIYIHYAQTE